MRVERSDKAVVMTLELADPRSVEHLSRALDELIEATSDLAALLEIRNFRCPRWQCSATFRSPAGELGEREFFEACAKYRELHAKIVRYSDTLVEGCRGVDFANVSHLCHDELFPAGAFAIVPVAFADRTQLPALIRHMRAVDLYHAISYQELVDRLLQRHGICEETLDLLAYRASDGSLWSEHNLWLAVHAHGLRDRWHTFGGADAFAERIRRISEDLADDADDSESTIEKLVEIGHELFDDDKAAFDRWCARCSALWTLDVTPTDAMPEWQRPTRRAAFTDAEWQAVWNDKPEPRGRTVLVVSEDSDVAALVAKALPGDRVETASSFAEALRRAPYFGVVLVDYHLDGGSGSGLILQLRAERPSLPMVAIATRERNNALLVRAGANAACPRSDLARIRWVIHEATSKLTAT